MANKVYVPIYAEGDLTPKAVDTVRGIVKDKFPGYDIQLGSYVRNDQSGQVLVLGKVTEPDMIAPNHRPVYTYSVAQIMTKANAATVLAAAIRQFIDEPEPIPFNAPKYRMSTWGLAHWAHDVPTAIDIETSGNLGETHTPEEVGLISIAFYQPGFAPVVYVARTDEEGHSPEFTQEQLDELREHLPKFTKGIYHNGKFEQRVLNRILGIKLCVWADTMLMHHTLNQAAGDHKLKHLARLYLGAPDWEAGISKYLKGGGHYELIPRDKLVEYNGWDVYWTYKLWELFAPQIEADENAQTAYFFEQQIAEFLLKVEARGIPFDKQYAGQLADMLDKDAERELDTMCTITGNDKFNPGSWQQVKRYLKDAWDIDTPSTDEKHITAIRDSVMEGSAVHSFCVSLLSYRKATKMRGTYAVGWAKHERKGRVHPTFLVHGTSTGRLSSTGPNAQNMVREKRIRRLVSLADA